MLEENATSPVQDAAARTSRTSATNPIGPVRPGGPGTGPDRPSPVRGLRQQGYRPHKALPEPVRYSARLSPCPAEKCGVLSCRRRPPGASHAASLLQQRSASTANHLCHRFSARRSIAPANDRWRLAIRLPRAHLRHRSAGPSRKSGRTHAAPSPATCRPGLSPPGAPAGAAAPPESAHCQIA